MSNHVKGMTSCRPPEKSNESEIKSNESEMDLINRQGAIDTAEAMHDRCDTLSVDDYRDMMVEALMVLPSANLQPTCNKLATDTISRSAALDVIRNIRAIAGSYDNEMLLIDKAEAQTELMMLPSAQPEDCDTCKHGYFGDGKCDNCRVRFPSHYERRADEGN